MHGQSQYGLILYNYIFDSVSAVIVGKCHLKCAPYSDHMTLYICMHVCTHPNEIQPLIIPEIIPGSEFTSSDVSDSCDDVL